MDSCMDCIFCYHKDYCVLWDECVGVLFSCWAWQNKEGIA